MIGRGEDATGSYLDGLQRRPAATCDRLQPCDQPQQAGPLTLNSRVSAVSRVAKMATRQTKTTSARTRRRLANLTLIFLLTVSTSGCSAASGRLERRQATPAETPPPTETTTVASATTTTTTAAAAAATSTTMTAAAAPTTGADTPLTSTPKARIPPVNFTRVDELFAKVMEEEEVARSWRKMDKSLQQGVGSLLKMIFPHVVSMASDAKVSGNCSGAILKWILNLKGMRTWAVQMLDAIGKPSAGLLEGSLTLFGNYRQCLQIRAPDEDEIEIADGEFREYFRGQYCRLQIRPPLARKPHFYSLNSSMPSLLRKSYKYYERTAYDELSELAMAFHFVDIRADLCVPSLCSRDDIQRVADFLTSKLDMRARVQRCEVQPYEETPDGLATSSRLDISHLLWSMTMVVVLMLVLVSTLASLVLRMRKRNSKSKRRSLFTAMSLYRSLGHIRNVQLDRINATKPAVLYSLRTVILIWICLVSLTSQLNFQYLREMLTLRSLIMEWPLQLIVNSSLAFDSLILLTSFTYAYQNINSNFSDLIKYNVSKYIRLMPSIMLLVALTIITPLFYQWQSPLWHDFVDEPAQVCKSTGLVNLFFIQNLISSQHICLPQTWLFCVELQLCLLAIPIVYLMNRSFDSNQGRFRWGSKPILLVALLALAGCLINFLNVYLNQLPAAWFQTFPDKEDKHLYNTLHLHKTWTHLTSFAVGLFAGHLCRCQTIGSFSGRPYGRRCCNTLMWLASSLLMFALIFSTRAWSLSDRAHLEAPLASALYAGLSPLLWSVSLSMILFQLVVPQTDNKQQLHSGLTQWLTSDVNLIRIGRLSFLAYLLNPYVNTLVYAIQEQAIFSSLLMLGHFFIGNLVITFALAFLVSALVELPCRRLLKKLLVGSRRHSTNLDIIQRQSDQNLGSSHDAFLRHAPPPPPLHVASSAEQKYAQALGGQTAAPRQNPASFQQQQQQQMIPLK